MHLCQFSDATQASFTISLFLRNIILRYVLVQILGIFLGGGHRVDGSHGGDTLGFGRECIESAILI